MTALLEYFTKKLCSLRSYVQCYLHAPLTVVLESFDIFLILLQILNIYLNEMKQNTFKDTSCIIV